MPAITAAADPDAADRNWRRFVWFRVLFNARFYYPVLAVLFLDLGLSATQYTLLNFAWALAIVAVDLPAGVLADRIGRRPLVVAAAGSMVVEMVLLCVAPRNGGTALFLCCLANRLLSGAAEGMASGADEALVFDSLAERGRETEWPQVLDQVLRWQSLGFVVAMLVGGAVYDPRFLNRLFGTHLGQGTTLRFPIYLNLVSAGATLFVALGLREPGKKAVVSPAEVEGGSRSAGAHLLAAGRWIARTPLALFAILAGVTLDSVVRLFMTFGSSYYRLIHLPSASYGLIGAGLGGLGLLVPPVARRMVTRGGAAGNFALLAGVTLAALAGLALRWPLWGVGFVVPLGMAMSAVSYLVSYYLNAAVDSAAASDGAVVQRAGVQPGLRDGEPAVRRGAARATWGNGGGNVRADATLPAGLARADARGAGGGLLGEAGGFAASGGGG